MISEYTLRTGIKETPHQKSYGINAGVQSFTVDFRGANKRFSFLETSSVQDKNDQHNTILDSYNIEATSILYGF